MKSMTTMTIVTAAAAAFMAVSTVEARSLRLMDGEYSCSLNLTMIPTILGSIWIHGNSYVGLSRDPKGPSHSFTVTSSGTINWSSPMGGMDTNGSHVVGTVVTDVGGGKTGFDIQYQTSNGHTDIASCEPAF